ncbi:AMP-binding protein [Acidihalobacter ferrooxydans]|uniref:Long-chain-fatty-acid--CoA ligase n=1 Tax=Acidihalobacter ferrooxydans TaxID=1765967 RepID=A0A1P8UED1_9GAMM|nr:AMP-binding protein [Acidihalobacter ferrooxydans]APZ42191.1 long-chain-fatty-acid--CoA ligase [Acidihalobacter ferrooxydans]
MTQHPWYASYDPQVPHTVDIDSFASIVDVFERSCAEYADRPAFTNMGVQLGYAELDRLSRDFAAWLQHGAGLARGDRVALMMPNVLQYPVALYGALRAGCVVVNVNPLYTPRELEHQLRDSGAKVIVLLDTCAHTLEQVRERGALEQIVLTHLGDLFAFPKSVLVNAAIKYVKKRVPAWSLDGVVWFKTALRAGARETYVRPALTHADLAFLQYTGGTTGRAKGAMLSHGNMVANILQASAWITAGLRAERPVVVTALPLYHIFSLTANCFVFMHVGGENLLITDPRDCKGFVRTLARSQFTAITGVNTLFKALMDTEGFERIDFSRLEVALGGGMAVQQPVAERWKALTGKPLIEAYGLTETSPAACINPLSLHDYNGCIGLPVSSTEVAIMDETGHELPVDTLGEICVRGPQVTAGYWNQPEETAATFFPGGWLRTGDVGSMDARGFVKLADRIKDMVVVSGFNVYPNEVEAVLVEHPGVAEAAVVGVPSADSGEALKAFVVRRDPDLTAEALIAHCRTELTGYKVPKLIEFRDDLPKTNVGKILRRALRDMPESASQPMRHERLAQAGADRRRAAR